MHVLENNKHHACKSIVFISVLFSPNKNKLNAKSSILIVSSNRARERRGKLKQTNNSSSSGGSSSSSRKNCSCSIWRLSDQIERNSVQSSPTAVHRIVRNLNVFVCVLAFGFYRLLFLFIFCSAHVRKICFNLKWQIFAVLMFFFCFCIYFIVVIWLLMVLALYFFFISLLLKTGTKIHFL